MRGLFLLSLLVLYFFAPAQEISGTINDPQGFPIKDASVSLLLAKDSSVQNIVNSDSIGHYWFFIDRPGLYQLKVTSVGFTTVYSRVVRIDNASSKMEINLVCHPSFDQLKTVKVEARKPLLEVMADKMVVNVEGTINAVGKNALEILRLSPGVAFDNEDNISLSGKNGVQVFIDGKESPLARTDLTNYLRTLPSSEIEAIELITNPSAKYEAAGNAGIINIRLKRNKAFGTNGTVTTNGSIGVYLKYSGGFSLNYRNKRFSIFSSYNYQHNKNLINTSIYRVQQDSAFKQTIRRIANEKSSTIKVGMDYAATAASTIGIMVLANPYVVNASQQSSTLIFYQPTMEQGKTLEAPNNGKIDRFNSVINVNYHYTRGEKEITIDGDHGHYHHENEQWQPNSYYSSSNAFLYSRIYSMSAPSTIQLSSVKFDYTNKLGTGKLDLGGKLSFVKSENNFQRFDVYNNQKQLDSSRSNEFIFKENINALYANYRNTFQKLSVQFGLRMEHTVTNGTSHGFIKNNWYVAHDSSFKRQYTNFFPSFSITYKKNQDHQFSISYSKRIDRPAYQDLNPFEFKVDEYTYTKGNINLNPQYTNSFGATYVYKGKLTAALNYSQVKAVFTQVYDTIETTKTFISKINLSDQKILSLNLDYNIQYRRYYSTININSYYSRYKANLGLGRQLDIDILSANIQLLQSIRIGKTYTAEMQFYYSSPSIWQGTFKSKTITSLELGLQKTFLDNKLVVKASLWDVGFAYKYHGISNFAGQYLDIRKSWEPNMFTLNLTYRFGNSQLKAIRQHKTGLEEESSRLRNASGTNQDR